MNVECFYNSVLGYIVMLSYMVRSRVRYFTVVKACSLAGVGSIASYTSYVLSRIKILYFFCKLMAVDLFYNLIYSHRL